MTKLQRVKEVFTGLFMIIGGVVMMALPQEGYIIVAFILAMTLLIKGFSDVLYYFTMARHMVGGKVSLYTGIITMDVGIFAITLTNIPTFYVMLYLLCCHAFSGAVDILRALEAKSYEGRWKLNMAYGVVNILIALLAFFGGISSRSMEVIVYIYSAGLIYSAFLHVAKAFRKSAIVYIQ